MGPTWNIWRINIAPPPIEYGLALRAPQGGGPLAAHHHLRARSVHLLGAATGGNQPQARNGPTTSPSPTAFAIFAYFSLVVVRPVLLGAWGFGFPYGIFSHLDWVSNVGYQYLHFHYNPAHMIAVSFFFTTTLALSLHGGLILSAVNPQKGQAVKTAEYEDGVLPRPHRLLDWCARASTAWGCFSRSARVLERRLHHHQRSLLDARLARVVELVAEPSRVELTAEPEIAMAEYQNIFTQIQVRGPADFGPPIANERVPVAPGTASCRLIGWFGSSQVGPDLPRLPRGRLAGLRLHRHRDHRPQHVGLGGLEPDPVHPPAALARARAAAALKRPALAGTESGWLVADGGLLPHRLDPAVVAADVPARDRARHGNPRRLGVRVGDLALSGRSASSAPS